MTHWEGNSIELNAALSWMQFSKGQELTGRVNAEAELTCGID